MKRTQAQKQFSRKKTYIFFEKLLFAMYYSLVYILNNFFHSVFCPLNCFGWSKKFKIYRNLEFLTSTMITCFPITVHFIVQVGNIRKRLRVLLSFFGICSPVFPSLSPPRHSCHIHFYLQVLNTNFHHQRLESIRPYMHVFLEQKN